MKFQSTPLEGVYLITPELIEDSRGFFARGFCANEFKAHNLPENFVQCNLSFNHKAGTTRGLHYQRSPHEEVKVVRCTQGAIFDVAVDMRQNSPTYLQWFGAELNTENRAMLSIPKGFAHGYQTLSDNAEVFYLVSEFYTPGAEGGLRWDDPAIGVKWPHAEDTIEISEKDANWPLINSEGFTL